MTQPPRSMREASYCEEHGHPFNERAAVAQRVENTLVEAGVLVVCLRCGQVESGTRVWAVPR